MGDRMEPIPYSEVKKAVPRKDVITIMPIDFFARSYTQPGSHHGLCRAATILIRRRSAMLLLLLAAFVMFSVRAARAARYQHDHRCRHRSQRCSRAERECRHYRHQDESLLCDSYQLQGRIFCPVAVSEYLQRQGLQKWLQHVQHSMALCSTPMTALRKTLFSTLAR